MADNNLARNRNDGPDIFADDDPLAELARIVGYDERLVPKPPMAERREPAFNLEDELLHEFERYDAPRPHQSGVHAPDVVEQPQSTVLSEDVLVEPSLSASPADAVRDDLAELEWSAVEEAFGESSSQVEAGAVNVEPVFDLGLPQGAVEPVRWVDQAPVEETSFSAEEPVLDLADELELTLQDAPEADLPTPQEPVQRSETVRKGGYTPGFRMPLANFNRRDEVQPAAGSQEEPLRAPTPYAGERLNDVEAAHAAAVTPEEPAEAPGAIKIEQPVAAVAEASVDFSALDALIRDVSHYSVPEPAIAGDAPEAASVSPPPEPVEARVSLPKDASAARDSDPLFDDDFELALDDLELDLSDIMSDDDLGGFSEPKPAAPVAAAVPVAASVEVPPPAEATRVTATWSPVARFVPTPATPMAPAVPVLPVAAAVAAPQSAPVDVAEPADLPFDPALIAESEEQPEAIVELDVPVLHAEEPEETPVYRNDYDYDIDAELAALLQSTPSAANEPETPEQQPVAAQAPQPAASPAYPDLDDFERAMEEDFRRTLTTPLQPLAATEEGPRSFIRPAEGSRWSLSALTLPLAVAGVVIAGGSIGYALLGGDSGSATGNGEPVVIAADTDPVKVLPENPGGKTVPNQDKAVYDRVAGGANDAPKQETLISTSEEPVDVVQKTLMADSLPMEGENSAGAADSALPAQVQDDRLLPEESVIAGLPMEAEQQPIAVMPRRVKTMIVRPDGTLVEQEVPAEPAPVAAQAQTDKVPAASTRDVDVASIPAATAGAAGIVPTATDPAAAQTTAAEAGNEPAADASSANAPVPTARPAAQPVDIVASVSDQGNVRTSGEAPATSPAAETAAPATQVAAVAPGGYLIQIASLPSEADAQKSYQNLSAKFGSIIGGRGVDIKQAEIAGKGTFYRVRIPAGSKADAVALCEKYRAAGGSCLVAR